MKTAWVDGRTKNKGKRKVSLLPNADLSSRLMHLSVFLYNENRPVIAREVIEAARRLKDIK